MNRKGFTLLELLMVVLVVGALASLMLPTFQGAVEKARAAEAIRIISAIKMAELAYITQVGQKYPDNNIIYGGPDQIRELGVEVPANETSFWNYQIQPLMGPTFGIVARRTSKSGGNTTHYIAAICVYEESPYGGYGYVVWTANPPNLAPQQ